MSGMSGHLPLAAGQESFLVTPCYVGNHVKSLRQINLYLDDNSLYLSVSSLCIT